MWREKSYASESQDLFSHGYSLQCPRKTLFVFCCCVFPFLFFFLFLRLVSRVDSQEGEIKNLTWTAELIPQSGEYNIYHFYGDTSNTIIRIESKGAVSRNYSKYAYHTTPYNSTNMIIEVKSITLMDAGYYWSGTSHSVARIGQGAILVVKGKIVNLIFIFVF